MLTIVGKMAKELVAGDFVQVHRAWGGMRSRRLSGAFVRLTRVVDRRTKWARDQDPSFATGTVRLMWNSDCLAEIKPNTKVVVLICARDEKDNRPFDIPDDTPPGETPGPGITKDKPPRGTPDGAQASVEPESKVVVKVRQ